MTPPNAAGRAALRKLVPRVRLIVFDFDGVLTDNTVIVSQDGSEAVRCWRGDGLGLSALRARGVNLLIMSMESNAVVSARAAKLKVECMSGVIDKGTALSDVMRKRGFARDQVAYVGNDANDLPCLQMVGLPIVVRDAHPSVMRAAKWRTTALGGRGAVREICDTFVEILERHG